jgi:alginate O-acetyltransferase complex protein AlgJ
MKRTVIAFVTALLLAAAVVPAINLARLDTAPPPEGTRWWHRSVLYNLDFALPRLGLLLYRRGISLDPEETVVGKDGWLFLGDKYQKTLSVHRRAPQPADAAQSRRIDAAQREWDAFYRAQGVQSYQVVVGADKGGIYPEYLPDWARPAPRTPTDYLIETVPESIYVDTRPALRAARSRYLLPLYYRTDTHWNDLGGWVAFQAFAQVAARRVPGLRWPKPDEVRPKEVVPWPGGDLANFLRIGALVHDENVSMRVLRDEGLEIERIDYRTGKLIARTPNVPLPAPRKLILVRSPNALNDKRVLWLRDSFGNAMSPYMAATFKDVVQVHFGEMSPIALARLVGRYRPDFVFVTVVERDARQGWFEQRPPLGLVLPAPTQPAASADAVRE